MLLSTYVYFKRFTDNTCIWVGACLVIHTTAEVLHLSVLASAMPAYKWMN